MHTRNLMFIAAVALAAGGTASAQSLSSGFTGTTVVPNEVANTGNMFDLTALNPGGITVNSFDVHSRAPAGTPIEVEIYTKPESLLGWVTDPSAWTLLGTAMVPAGGPTQPTPVPVGGLNIPAGQTYGVYVNITTAAAGVRYNNRAQTEAMSDPANDDLRISFVLFGPAVNGLFGSVGTFTPRAWNGTVHYTAHGSIITGACCMPSGVCEIRGEIDCENQDGIYNGDNTACETIPPCAQPGACCLVEGGCSILSQGQCGNIAGNYWGDGTACETTPCPGGACCLADGTCVFTTDFLCSTEFLGTFWGDGTSCGDQRCATLPLLWNNGPLITETNVACAGGNLSLLDLSQGITTLGFGWASPTVAVADSFTVPDGEHWSIQQIKLWGYQTGATTATINFVGLQIWDGIPGDPGSNIVAGDVAVNALTTAVITDDYRASTNNLVDCSRRLQELTCSLSASLPAGTYWLEASSGGTSTSGPWIPPVTFRNRAAKPFATGFQRLTAGWQELVGGGAAEARSAVPFHIIGAIGEACYANCDESTVQPILNVDDFTCFINEFAAAQSLPHEQQVTHYANCDNSTVAPVLNVDDFTCFINEFAQGCP